MHFINIPRVKPPRFRYGRKSAELFGYLDPAAPEYEAIRIDAFREIMLEK